MMEEAVIRGEDGTFLRFSDPIEGCETDDWREFASRVEPTTRHSTVDDGLGGGAWVGHLTYEGHYRFSHFGPPEVLSDSDVLASPLFPSPKAVDAAGWDTSASQPDYENMVRAAQEAIRAGEIYQVNLCRELSRNVRDFDPFAYFQAVWQMTEAPGAAYLAGPEGAVISASPERFLAIQGQRIETVPIKGTRPRNPDPLRDRQNAFELSTHEKEIAELIMITDLERNDLGKICEYGSVNVSELASLQTYSHVHHLHSRIEGELRRGVGPVEAVAACFPGGSITGAPKKRAMEIITSLEHFQRGVYTGAIGYFGRDGSAALTIAIRTAVYEPDRLSFGVGCGITAGSIPEMEWRETEQKAACLLQAYAAYEQRRATIHV